MDQLKDTLAQVMKGLQHNISDENSPENIEKRFFSAKERKHIKLRRAEKGVLWVIVDSPAWSYYFNLRKAALLAKLKALPDAGIKELRFAVGAIE
jgi:hypothetical protein